MGPNAYFQLSGQITRAALEHVEMVMVMVMNLYGAFSIDMFKCALQASNLWVRSDSICTCTSQEIADMSILLTVMH